MTYFHPWTLRHNEADDHVKYVGHLRGANESWQEALESWLDGIIVCAEAARYVGIFFYLFTE